MASLPLIPTPIPANSRESPHPAAQPKSYLDGYDLLVNNGNADRGCANSDHDYCLLAKSLGCDQYERCPRTRTKAIAPDNMALGIDLDLASRFVLV